jgi:hypothetical protein
MTLSLGQPPSTELPAATETSEKWRSITACHLYEQMTQEYHHRERKALVKRVAKSIRESLAPSATDNSLDKLLSKEEPQLQKVVETGWEVAATFAQQRCRLELWTAQAYDNVESRRVDVRGKLEDRPNFIFTVSPALLKWGSGYGKDLEQSIVIVKSKVLLGR